MSALALLACSAANAAPSTAVPTFDGVSIYAGSEGNNVTINPFITFPYSSVAVRYGVPGSIISTPYTTKVFDRNTSFVCQTSTFGIADPMSGQSKTCEVSVSATLTKLILPDAVPEREVLIYPVSISGGLRWDPVVIDQNNDTLVSFTNMGTQWGYFLLPAGSNSNSIIGSGLFQANTNGFINGPYVGMRKFTVWKTLPKTSGWAMVNGPNKMGIDLKNGYFRYGVAAKWYYTKVVNGVIMDSAVQSYCGGDPYPGQTKSCQVLVDMAADCAATTSSWTGTNGAQCGALAGATASGSSIQISNTLAPNAGTAVLTCTNGVFNKVGSSCTVPAPAACAATILTWDVNNAICNGSFPALASGASSTISSTNPGSTGSATYQCSNGSFTNISKTCVSAKLQCDASTGDWVGTNGELCSGALPALPLLGTGTAINYNLPTQGNISLTCVNGIFYKNGAATTCTAAPGCSTTRLPWTGTNNEYCEATVAAAASGGTYSLKNSFNTNFGAATATCVRGTFVASSAICSAPPPSNSTWTNVLSENGATVAKTTGLVRYGVEGYYVYRPVTADMTVICSNAFFGLDPKPGVVKNCALSNTKAPDTWQTIATEGENPAYGGPLLVRYGTTDNWSYSAVPAAFNICSAAVMGAPPKAGSAGACQIFAGAPQWVDIAKQDQIFRANTSMVVRYGYGESWVYRTFASAWSCNKNSFMADPSPSNVKTCQVSSTFEKWTKAALVNGTLTSNFYPAFYRYGVGNQYVTRRLFSAATCSVATFGYDPAPGQTSACYKLDRFSSSFDPGTDPWGIQAILATETPTSPAVQNTSRSVYQTYAYEKALDAGLDTPATAEQLAQVKSLRATTPDPATRLQTYMDNSSGIYKLGTDASGVTFTSTQDKNAKISQAISDWLRVGNGTQTGMELLTNMSEQAQQMVTMEMVAVSKLSLTDPAKNDELKRRLISSGWIHAGTIGAQAIQLRLPNFKFPNSTLFEFYGNVRVSIPTASFFGVSPDGSPRGGVNMQKSYDKGRINTIVSLEVGGTFGPLAAYKAFRASGPVVVAETEEFDFLKSYNVGLGGEVHFAMTTDRIRGLTRLDSFTLDLVADFGNTWYTAYGLLNRLGVGVYLAGTTVGAAGISAYEAGYKGWSWLRGISPPQDVAALAVADRQAGPGMVTAEVESVFTESNRGAITYDAASGTFTPNVASEGVAENALVTTINNNANNFISTTVAQNRGPDTTKVSSVDTVEVLAAWTWFAPTYAADLRCWVASTDKGQCDSTFITGVWTPTLSANLYTSGVISLNGLQARWYKDFWANSYMGGIGQYASSFGATLRYHFVSGVFRHNYFSDDAKFIVESTGIAGVLVAH